MNKPLILLGGGGHCKSVIEVAESSGKTIKGILDLPSEVGKTCLGYPILGSDEDIPLYVDECEFVVTLGFIKDPIIRIKLHQMVLDSKGEFATIVASSAQVSKHATIAPGTVVLHNACINAGAQIGHGCIINTLACIEHDTIIEDYCHISTGAIINGGSKIGRATFIGSQAIIAQSINIPPECVVSAGEFINKTITSKGIIKTRSSPT